MTYVVGAPGGVSLLVPSALVLCPIKAAGTTTGASSSKATPPHTTCYALHIPSAKGMWGPAWGGSREMKQDSLNK